ncbi:hypothetical protein CHCC20335_0927 [Bacillus paralicheniformis]|nr:hypothetical protein CHCC20335_0927 [Bacillus paralicheniformis]
MDADKISSFYDHESKVTQVEKLQNVKVLRTQTRIQHRKTTQ